DGHDPERERAENVTEEVGLRKALDFLGDEKIGVGVCPGCPVMKAKCFMECHGTGSMPDGLTYRKVDGVEYSLSCFTVTGNLVTRSSPVLRSSRPPRPPWRGPGIQGHDVLSSIGRSGLQHLLGGGPFSESLGNLQFLAVELVGIPVI